jgi:N-acetylmuramoyl-L-alanine amidase
MELRFSISQPVPWRLRLMDNPPRLVIDTREVDWTGTGALPLPAGVVALRAGSFRPGWSRLVVELAGPMQVVTSEMQTAQDAAVILVRLAPTDPASFAARSRPTRPAGMGGAGGDRDSAAAAKGQGPITVVLDPGHGGIDPGPNATETEAALMLTFARELKEVLVRDGRFNVVLTRDDDVFVPLETRTSIARDAEADIFLSLHADALAEGEATGGHRLHAGRNRHRRRQRRPRRTA